MQRLLVRALLVCALVWGCASRAANVATISPPATASAAPASTPATPHPDAQGLIGARAVMAEIARGPESEHVEDPAAAPRHELRAALERFSSEASKLSAAEAAKGWLALLDRFFVISGPNDYRLKPDERIELKEVFAALPPPSAWSALSSAIEARIASPAATRSETESLRNQQLLVISLFLEGRNADFEKQLARLEAATDTGPGSAYMVQHVRALRLDMARRSISTPEQLAQFLGNALKAQTRGEPRVEIVDLVALLGPVRARELITQALSIKKVKLSVTQAPATRKLVKAIVLEKLASLERAPWELVDGPDDVELFEALTKRFPLEKPDAAGKAAKRGDSRDQAALFEAMAQERQDYSLPAAKAAYVLGLVSRGRSADALAFSAQLDDSAWDAGLSRCLPRSDLVKDGAAFMAFFDKVLESNPEAPVWDTYVSLALATDRGELLRQRLEAERARRPRAMDRFELDGFRASLLWAMDKLDEAYALTKALAETSDEGFTPEEKLSLPELRRRHGETLATVGRLLGRSAWIDEGIAIVARSEEKLRATGSDGGSTVLCALLSQNKRYKDAERCLADRLHAQALAKKSGASDNYRTGELLEQLASLYAEVGRDADVLTLVDEMSDWRGDDLTTLEETKIPVSVARALLAAGQRARAIALLEGLVLRRPGADGPYEVLVEALGTDAIAWLDRLYARNQFEERPLIWKAYALLRAGNADEAKKVAKQALNVDPTDGEQPAGDRERGFAVLADVLAAQGATDEAERYRNIVKAVRIAERGDELTEAGLIRRSAETYRAGEALAQKAYCIHWRLAERLFTLGALDEARKHYEIAFRYMPEQFGRVANFCFGCQGVFEKEQSQRVANEVLTTLSRTTPDNPRVHFLLGKLYEAQGRMRDAYDAFQRAITLDPTYLDALTEINGLQEVVLRPNHEWDAIRFKLLDVNPVEYASRIGDVRDMKTLWTKLAALQGKLEPAPTTLYPLAAVKKAREGNPEAAMQAYYSRAQMPSIPTPGRAVAENPTLQALAQLLDATRARNMW